MDDATYRVGLGWRVRERDAQPVIGTVSECTAFLNQVVRVVLDDLCAILRGLDRRSLVMMLLTNHEQSAEDRGHWKRTSQAVLGLHNDKDAAVAVIVEHLGRLNAVSTACRTLLEAAICECPLSGGRAPGRLDLTRLMGLSMLAFYFGGWSDAIHWGAAKPTVKVRPYGDIHMDHSFMDTVFEPFGRSGVEYEVQEASESYARLYRPRPDGKSVGDVFDPRFIAAWQEEFGIRLEAALAFLGRIEESSVDPPRATAEFSRSALCAMLVDAAGVSQEAALRTLELITLAPRPQWRAVLPPFIEKDWYPWRFRRRLSVLRRPLVQINDAADPTILCAPGLLGESLRSMVTWFETGEIPSTQARSRAMTAWIGHANNVQRVAFNAQVAERLRELGWQARSEVTLPYLLGKKLDRDYGDVDVLAWKPDTGRVLVIECKDVQYNKTLGEVAEQLSDFRGGLQSDGRPDRLKRHLDRMEVLAAHPTDVGRKLKLSMAAHMEGHLVFRNPVPMRYAWDHMANKVRLSLFSELEFLE